MTRFLCAFTTSCNRHVSSVTLQICDGTHVLCGFAGLGNRHKKSGTLLICIFFVSVPFRETACSFAGSAKRKENLGDTETQNPFLDEVTRFLCAFTTSCNRHVLSVTLQVCDGTHVLCGFAGSGIRHKNSGTLLICIFFVPVPFGRARSPGLQNAKKISAAR